MLVTTALLAAFKSRGTLVAGILLACLPIIGTAWAQSVTFDYTGAAQTLRIAITGTYQITVAGAQGGNGGNSRQGGAGAVIIGNYAFSAGEVLNLIAGGSGSSSTYGGGGGGGGSFIFDQSNNTLVVVASGGGGAGSNRGGGGGGQVTTSGAFGSGAGAGAGGSNGDGGAANPNDHGGGGGGFLTAGQNSGTFATGGAAYPSLAGGVARYGEAGGYGGGGAGTTEGGGGGGYSGGGGGSGYLSFGGGGGGSYEASGFTLISATAGSSGNAISVAGNFGNGYISYLLSQSNISGQGGQLSDVGSSLTTEFDGGALTSDANATSSASFTITGKGGTLDAAGHTLVFTGVFSNANGSTPGHLIISSNPGTGGVIVLDPIGANTFTGGIQVLAGATLQIASASALGSGTLALLGTATTPAELSVTGTTAITDPIVLEGDPTFDIASGATTTISSVISNATPGSPAGDLVKQGGGTLVLTGANTYTGATTIDAGTLALSGTGGIADSAAVTNNATFDLSGSRQSIRLGGNYTQSGSGMLVLDATPTMTIGTGYSQLLANGRATLSGALGVDLGSGTYAIGGKYDLIHASGGVSGIFSQVGYVGSFGPYILPSLVYQSDDVYLELSPQPVLVDSGRAYVASRFTINEALFDDVDAILGGGMADGDRAGSARSGVWMHALGNFGSANGFDFHTGGTLVGRGFPISPVWIAGFAVNALFTGTSGRYGTVNNAETGIAFYGIYDHRHLKISFSNAVGGLSDNFERLVPEFGIGARAGGAGVYDVAAMRAQYALRQGLFFLAPDIEAAYAHTQIGTVVETGAGSLGLTYEALATDLGRISAGITGGMILRRSFGTVEPFVSTGGYGSVGQCRYSNVETLQLASSMQTASAAATAAYTAGAGVEVIGTGHWRGEIYWEGVWGDSNSTQDLGLAVRYVW